MARLHAQRLTIFSIFSEKGSDTLQRVSRSPISASVPKLAVLGSEWARWTLTELRNYHVFVYCFSQSSKI